VWVENLGKILSNVQLIKCKLGAFASLSLMWACWVGNTGTAYYNASPTSRKLLSQLGQQSLWIPGEQMCIHCKQLYCFSDSLLLLLKLLHCSCSLASHIQDVVMSSTEGGFGGAGWCICSEAGLCCAIASWLNQATGML